jgi:hypothetical protein
MDIMQINLASSGKETTDSIATISPEQCAPIGTFADSNDFVVRIRDGRPIAANTGEQGGGQN